MDQSGLNGPKWIEQAEVNQNDLKYYADVA